MSLLHYVGGDWRLTRRQQRHRRGNDVLGLLQRWRRLLKVYTRRIQASGLRLRIRRRLRRRNNCATLLIDALRLHRVGHLLLPLQRHIHVQILTASLMSTGAYGLLHILRTDRRHQAGLRNTCHDLMGMGAQMLQILRRDRGCRLRGARFLRHRLRDCMTVIRLLRQGRGLLLLLLLVHPRGIHVIRRRRILVRLLY